MSVFLDDTFLSCDEKTQIHVRRCIPDGEVRGIVQIAHGIAEYAERYDAFAQYLASRGFLTVANDHLGHGQSVSAPEELGFLAENGGWELIVGDMHRLYARTSAEFPQIPYFLFGHSMGSFLARTYLINYPDELDGAVLCGTGQQASALIQSGRNLGHTEIRRKGANYRSQLLNSIAFGAYNKQIPQHRTGYDWLTRDPEIVDAYVADPLCGFVPTAGLFTEMMEGLSYITNPNMQQKMRKSLPVFFISGDQDPVGEYGKGVFRAYNGFLRAGMENIILKLYHNCRHELLNELCKDTVMQDVADWLDLQFTRRNN